MSSGKNAKRAGSTSQVWGYVIVLTAALSFILSMYMMFFSKLLLYIDDLDADVDATASSSSMTTLTSASASAADAIGTPNEGVGLLRAIELDVYYCYLLPLTIPVSVVAFYANWVSLKFFRHN